MNKQSLCSETAKQSHQKFASKLYDSKFASKRIALLDHAFGPDRLKKSSYKLRESSKSIDFLSHMIVHEKSNELDKMVATIAYSELDVSGVKALLLGPLAVDVDYQSMGFGKQLINETIAKAVVLAPKHGWAFVLLVGDLDYYLKCGFNQVQLGAIDYPKPTDPKRILYFEFEVGSLKKLIDNSKLPLKLNQNK